MIEAEVSNKKPLKYLIWLIVSTGIVRLIIAGLTGLGYGESYYAGGVVHPQLSYFDQPPLAFWMSWVSTEIFGSITAFTLRLPMIILFAGITYLMYVLGKKLFGAWAGFYAALLLNLSMVFSFCVGMWFQPDGPLMFFWLACALVLTNIFMRDFKDKAEKKAYRRSCACYGMWLLAGVLLGLTTLSKYHAIFLFAGVGIFALTRKEDRHWVFHPGPYLALIINFIVAAPVFIWNYQNGWVSFLFQVGRAGTNEFAIHFDWFFRAIGGQALWLLPWIWLPLIWQLWVCLKKGSGDRARWFCACTAVLPILFFTIVTLWADLGFHFHWQAPGYLMLFLPLGFTVADFMKRDGAIKVWTKRLLYISAVVTLFVGVVLQVHMKTGFWTVLGPKWFAEIFGEENDPTMEGYDYDELIDFFAREGWLEDDNIFVTSNRWWLVGKLDWGLKNKKQILCLDYDPRNIAFYDDQKDFIGKDAILISTYHEDQVRNRASESFESITRLPDFWITRAGVNELCLNVYYCKNFIKPFPYKYGKGISSSATVSK